ncbi:MAG TPA: metalloregulator ArsR/SmtB family transcription factor [Blastocatellia bacterium]|nr:metalloregulator ArsR/SmtB family transcription factor [Blastocatellia bacterium]
MIRAEQPNLDQTLNLALMALADPTRRAILRRLLEGETRVTDLAQPFAISLNSVSKHIRILERANLVRRRREGREHLLSFNPAPLDEAAAWIEAQRAFWATRLDALEALLRTENAPPAQRPASRKKRR